MIAFYLSKLCVYIHSSVSFAAGFPLAFILWNLPGTFYSFFYSFLPLKHLSEACSGLIHPCSEFHFTGSPTPRKVLPSARMVQGSQFRTCLTPLRRHVHLPSAHAAPEPPSFPPHRDTTSSSPWTSGVWKEKCWLFSDPAVLRPD